MVFDGFLQYGGNEIINAARTRAYLENLMPSFPFMHKTHEYDSLREALEHTEYRTPFLDNADWVETDTLNTAEDGGYGSVAQNSSHDFYGLYPLAIEGVEDSTMTSPTVESILDGSVPGAERDSGRPIRVRGLLVGATDLAVQTGMTWLRNALRANSCSMHGDMCGYSDLRYFLSKPDVCFENYATELSAGEGIPVGSISPATSPWIGPGLNSDPDASRLYVTRFVLPLTSGVLFKYGALAIGSSEVLEEHGPILLRRANHIPNPRFVNDTNFWTANTGTITRRDVGGNTYGRANQASPITYNTNWLPDPSFEHGDPESLGWRGSTDILELTGTTPPQGTHYASVGQPIGGTAWIEATMLGPEDDGLIGTLSLYKRLAGDAVVTVKDEAGATIFTTTLPQVGAGWTRISSINNVPMKKGYVLRVEAAAGDLNVDGFLLEHSDTLNTYYDGDTADIPGSNTYYDFVGGFSGASRRKIGVLTPISVQTLQTASPARQVIASFLMRAPYEEPSVLVELVDDTDTVITATTVSPTVEWQRFALGTPYGARLRLRLSSSTGLFDIDDVMLEPGETLRPYFDGSTPNVDDDYVTYWTGGVNASRSHIDWKGVDDPTFESPEGSVQATIRGDRIFRAYLDILEGEIDNVLFSHAWSNQIPMNMQLDQYDRTFHRVSTTTGIKKIRDVKLQVGSAMEVDFILTANNPHAFSTYSQEIFVTDLNATYYSDDLINEIKNPSMRSVTTGVVKDGTGTGPSTDATGTWVTSTAAAQAIGTFGEHQVLTVGTDLLVNAKYVFSAEVYGSDAAVRLTVDGAGVASPASSPTKALGGSYDRRWVEFTTAAAGTVNLSVLNAAVTTNVSTVGMRDAIVSFGTAHPPYFYGGTADTAAYDYSWEGAANASPSRRAVHVDAVAPIIDPDVPVLPTPPSPPTVPDVAVVAINEWTRYYVTIPAGSVPMWSKSVPYITLLSKLVAIRQVRIRFYPNPFGWTFDKVDPTTHCGEVVLSYLPANSTLTIDGVSRQGFASVDGKAPVTADHLLYGTDGRPVEWPDMSCGLSYIMTVDIPTTLNFSDLDVDFAVFRQE